MKENLVFDTSVILNFGKKADLEFVLRQVNRKYELLTTPEVVKEIVHAKSLKYHGALLKTHFAVREGKPVKIKDSRLQRLTQILGGPEISVILLALQLKAMAAIDDVTARKEATALALRVTGAVGLLGDCVSRRCCSDRQGLAIASRLQGNGFKNKCHPAITSFEDFQTTIQI